MASAKIHPDPDGEPTDCVSAFVMDDLGGLDRMGLPRKLSKSYSNPPIFNYFDKKDPNSSMHIAHDHNTARTLEHLTAPERRHNADLQDLDDEVCKVARRLKTLSREQRKYSKRSSKRSAGFQARTEGNLQERVSWRNRLMDLRMPAFFLLCAIGMLISVTLWHQHGGLHPEPGLGRVHRLRTRIGYIKSMMYTATNVGSSIPLMGKQADIFDIRLVVMSTSAQTLAENGTNATARRRLGDIYAPQEGFLRYKLLGDGEVAYVGKVELSSTAEREIVQTVNVAEKLGRQASSFELEFQADTVDGQPVAFLCQVIQMGFLAKHRFVIGILVFGATFVSIIFLREVVHRVYSAFVGTCVLHFVIALIQETPYLHELVTMIDFGTLTILFSMMILMHMLSLTGFFEWFTVRLVGASRQSPILLFFILSIAAGVLSAFLDNVTVTLLTGPMVFTLAKITGLRPMPVYLAITMASSIGGTATMIGDASNIVIGSKLGIGFEQFLIYNGPITLLMLPLSVGVLYWQFRHELIDDSLLDEEGRFNIDMTKLKEENAIDDLPTFRGIACIVAGVLVALLLHPWHGIEPAWFTVMGMFAAATVYHRHNVEELLRAVEWDTLLFFAILFVLVESLQELGVIRQFGNIIADLIMAVGEDYRMLFALALFIWMSAVGSAFIESMPYAIVVVTLLIDLRSRDIPGVDVQALVWPLSIGSCVGSIGSIMGSSTNLMAVAISNQFGKCEEDKVMSWHFLRYGFPLLTLLTTIAMVYHWVIFVGLGVSPN